MLALMLLPLSVPVWIIGMLRQRRLLREVRQAVVASRQLTELLKRDSAPEPEP